MKSYSINDCVQISVFPKTGTTFLDTMANEHSQIKYISNQIPEIFETNLDQHYISIREPLDRFISGFISMHNRSAGQYHGKPEFKKKNLILFDKIRDLDLQNAFKICLDFYSNDWSFDEHTSNAYVEICDVLLSKNIIFLDFLEVGNLLDSFGYKMNLDNNKNLHYYTNCNYPEDKVLIKTLILNNQEYYNLILEYLQPDLDFYKKWVKI